MLRFEPRDGAKPTKPRSKPCCTHTHSVFSLFLSEYLFPPKYHLIIHPSHFLCILKVYTFISHSIQLCLTINHPLVQFRKHICPLYSSTFSKHIHTHFIINQLCASNITSILLHPSHFDINSPPDQITAFPHFYFNSPPHI